MGIAAESRAALRRCSRHAGLSVALIAALALGIAASTAAFSILDAVVLHPYEWKSPESLVAIHSTQPDKRAHPGWARTWDRGPFSWQVWRDLQPAPALAQTAAWEDTTSSPYVLAGDRPVLLTAFFASSNLLPLLGVSIVAGRGFNGDEDRAPSDSIVISERTWHSLFASRPDIAGTRLVLSPYGFDKPETRTVVGVVSARFRLYGKSPDVLLPIGQRAGTSWALSLIGRRAPTASISAVQAAVAAVAHASEDFSSAGVRVVPLASDQAGRRATALWLLLGLGVLLLVIASSNVTSLLLAEAETRRRELSLRLALGASLRDLGRQLATELVLLGSVSVCIGIIIAAWFTNLVVARAPAGLPELEGVRVGWRSLLFCCSVGGLALALAGISPLLSLRFSSVSAVSIDDGHRTSGSGARRQRVLILIQVTLATVMVVMAGLLTENARRLEARPLGFDPKNLLIVPVMGTDVSRDGHFGQSPQVDLMVRGALERIRSVPGVLSAASVTAAPLSGRGVYVGVVGPAGLLPRPIQRELVSGNYFDTMSMRPSQGRLFHESERDPNIAVVSDSFARQVLGGHVVGSRITELSGRALTVIGSVSDMREQSQAEDVRPTFYVLGGATAGLTTFVVRTLPKGVSFGVVQTAIASVWPRSVVTKLISMEDVLDLSFADYRFRRSLALMFGVAGVVLSLLGLYSLMTRRVAQRRRELGIRAALGASPRGLATVVFREALMVGVGGAIFGLVISAWVGQMIGALLVTVSPVEPTIFVFAALGVNLAAIGAVIAPAVAAFRTDTVAVLRE